MKSIPGCFYNDPEMPADHLEKVTPLNKAESSALWQKFVSPSNRHLMLLDDTEWPSKLIVENACWYYWVDDWNNDDFSTFASMLSSLPVKNETVLHLFWMQECGITTTWEVFSQNWGNFLYEDEGVVIVVPDSSVSVILSNGKAWYSLSEKKH